MAAGRTVSSAWSSLDSPGCLEPQNLSKRHLGTGKRAVLHKWPRRTTAIRLGIFRRLSFQKRWYVQHFRTRNHNEGWFPETSPGAKQQKTSTTLRRQTRLSASTSVCRVPQMRANERRRRQEEVVVQNGVADQGCKRWGASQRGFIHISVSSAIFFLLRMSRDTEVPSRR